jgi:hypothetical protein
VRSEQNEKHVRVVKNESGVRRVLLRRQQSNATNLRRRRIQLSTKKTFQPKELVALRAVAKERGWLENRGDCNPTPEHAALQETSLLMGAVTQRQKRNTDCRTAKNGAVEVL